MKILKTLLFIVPSVIIVVALYAGFSTQSVTYTCENQLSLPLSSKVFVTVEKYHPWVSFLSTSQGKITYDVPIKGSESYNYLSKKQGELQLYNNDKTKILGHYSQLNKKLSLNTKEGSFQGKCQLFKQQCSNGLMY